MEAAASSSELTVLTWSVVLLIVHILIQLFLKMQDSSLSFLLTARDEEKPASEMSSRISRGLRNFGETYPAFIGLALALMVTSKTGGIAATGAWIWFWCRVAYIPIFAAGIWGLRTAVWLLSIVGLVMMLIRLWS